MKKKIWITNFIFKEVEIGETGHCMFCHQEVDIEFEKDKHIWGKCLPESERSKPPEECGEKCK